MIEKAACAVNAINVLDVFCSRYTVISAVTVQLIYHVSDLLTSACTLVNNSLALAHTSLINSSVHYTQPYA